MAAIVEGRIRLYKLGLCAGCGVSRPTCRRSSMWETSNSRLCGRAASGRGSRLLVSTTRSVWRVEGMKDLYALCPQLRTSSWMRSDPDDPALYGRQRALCFATGPTSRAARDAIKETSIGYSKRATIFGTRHTQDRYFATAYFAYLSAMHAIGAICVREGSGKGGHQEVRGKQVGNLDRAEARL